jgi:hypothetical protein
MKAMESTITCKYFAWISTKGAKQMMADGALFAGLIRDVPANLKPYLDPNVQENKQYVRLDGNK